MFLTVTGFSAGVLGGNCQDKRGTDALNYIPIYIRPVHSFCKSDSAFGAVVVMFYSNFLETTRTSHRRSCRVYTKLNRFRLNE